MKKLALLFICASLSLASTAGDLTSIYDIQYTEEASGDSPFADQVVTTTGIVTALTEFNDSPNGYYIQDGSGAWNGLYIFDNTNTPAIGDEVEVTGTIEEYYDFTEMTTLSGYSLLSSGNDLPDVLVLPTSEVGAEMYESVFVRVENANCTEENDGFGQWTVNDGSGGLLIGNDIWGYTATAGTIYHVQGVVSYSFSEWKLDPRMDSDIEVFVSVEEEGDSLEVAAYPNPCVDRLNFSGITSSTSVMIFGLDGKLHLQVQLDRNNMSIDMTELPTGNYLVQVQNKSTQDSFSIQKK